MTKLQNDRMTDRTNTSSISGGIKHSALRDTSLRVAVLVPGLVGCFKNNFLSGKKILLSIIFFTDYCENK